MATVYMEPGGDATYDTTLLSALLVSGGTLSIISGSLSVVTDFVPTWHTKSIQAGASGANLLDVRGQGNTGRVTVYIYLTSLPAATASIINFTSNAVNVVHRLRVTSAGVLQLWEAAAQIGSNGSTIAAGVLYRFTLCWNLTSTTVNEFRVYKNGGAADISVSNATITRIGAARGKIGNIDSDTSLDMRFTDVYFDNSNSANDIATDVRVTPKRPNANGSANNFSTQIGAGGSGYGSGHSPQVNERPSSQTNGWSMVGAGSAVTEEYTIEAAATGDTDISAATLINYMGWVLMKSALAETPQIVVGGTATNLTAGAGLLLAFMQAAGSSSYPGGGTDIGLITDTTVTTVSLYECGLLFAYTPALVVAATPFLDDSADLATLIAEF